MIKQDNKLINYDSVNATKNNLNCSYISYKIDPLKNIKKIHLKSIEITICLDDIRSPYNIFYYTITLNNMRNSIFIFPLFCLFYYIIESVFFSAAN